MQRPTERQVADWLRDLTRLLPRQDASPQEAADRLRELIPLLVDRYDSRDFTTTSREFVARHCPVFFPSYGQLCDLLDRAPRPNDHPPARAADDGGLNGMDRAWIAHWHKRQAEGVQGAALENLVSLIRGQSPKAWAVINGRESTPETTDVQREAVQRMVFLAESAQHRRAPAESTPLRDVSLHGDRLRQSREARGCNVPVVDDDGEQRV